jgi:phosphatidate cytidylyltransferase
MRDLGPRVLSAALLGCVALGLLYSGVYPFTALILMISLAMCWEWGRVVRTADTGSDTVLFVHGLAVAAAILLAAVGYAALALVALIAGTFVVGALRFGEKARLSALGVLYVGLPAVALVALRGSEPYGFQAVLFIILTVIATDTLAYFTGRSAGGPKLWPNVSPNKTWSGLIGGVTGAGFVGAIFGMTTSGASIGRLVMIGLALGLVSQGGDLAESALKRGFGVKDTSSLIPGHGGFMDRMDGLVVAAVAAALIGLAVNVYAPARALLLGN